MAHRDSPVPGHAMVLAAGFGKRMRPLTNTRPKPLVELMGRPLIDHVLDRLAAAGVSTAVVNVHHFADMLEAHLQGRKRPRIVISDERANLLDTGGGIAKALPLLGERPFLLVNSDSLWIEGDQANLLGLAHGFDPTRMDALLLLAGRKEAVGYAGRGDYDANPDATLRHRGERAQASFVYAGAAMISPALFADAPAGPFPITRLFARAEASGRLCGIALEGRFLHVGTPEAIDLAEDAIRSLA